MRRLISNQIVLFMLRMLLGATFVYAGFVKMQDPQAFADSIASFQLLPHAAINIVALALAPFEFLLGLLLLVGIRQRTISLTLGALCVLFGVAIAQALARGLQVDCGCFGSGPPSVWKNSISLMRDILLLCSAVALRSGLSIIQKRCS